MPQKCELKIGVRVAKLKETICERPFRIIYGESCDTKDCRNDAENLALLSDIYILMLHNMKQNIFNIFLKIIILISQH